MTDEMNRLLNIDHLFQISCDIPIELDQSDEKLANVLKEEVIRVEQLNRMQILLATHFAKYHQWESLPTISSSTQLEKVRIEMELQRNADSIYAKDAIRNDWYDEMPNEADELVYDGLEKAYNAAFVTPSKVLEQRSLEEQKKFRAQRTQMYLKISSKRNWLKHKLKRGNNALEKRLLKSFSLAIDSLLHGRNKTILTQMEKHAESDIQDYKQYKVQHCKDKLEHLKTADFANVTLPAAFSIADKEIFAKSSLKWRFKFLWKNCIIKSTADDGGENVLMRSAAWKANRQVMWRKKKLLASGCRKKLLREKHESDVLSIEECASRGKKLAKELFSHCKSDGKDYAASMETLMDIDVQKSDILQTKDPTDNLNKYDEMTVFLLHEATTLMKLILSNDVALATAGQDASQKFSHARIEAAVSGKELYSCRLTGIEQFDQDWKQAFKLALSMNKACEFARLGYEKADIDLLDYKQKCSKIKNPFLSSLPEKWKWLTVKKQNTALEVSTMLSKIPVHPSSIFFKPKNDRAPEKEDILSEMLPSSERLKIPLRKLNGLVERGSNAIVLADSDTSDYNYRHQILSSIASQMQEKNRWGIYMVVSTTNNVLSWQQDIQDLMPGIRSMPYWGSAEDLSALRDYWKPHKLYSKDGLFHIILTTAPTIQDSVGIFDDLLIQMIVYDQILPSATIKLEPGKTSDADLPGNDTWCKLLAIQCRNRVLVPANTPPRPSLSLDLRLVVHFLFPDLFLLKKRVYAWAIAGFNLTHLEQLGAAVEKFIVGDDTCGENWTKTIVQETWEDCKVEQEHVAIAQKGLEQSDAITAKESPVKKKSTASKGSKGVKRKRFKGAQLPQETLTGDTKTGCILCKKSFTKSGTLYDHFRSDHAPLGTWKCSECQAECYTEAIRKAHLKQHLEQQTATIQGPRKPYRFRYFEALPARTTEDYSDMKNPLGEDKSDDEGSVSDALRKQKQRERVTRCGKCSGCLGADCMKCGHCRDMKKYGGPGLRKQSCKNRKCIDPQVVILNTSKEERHAGSASVGHSMSMHGGVAMPTTETLKYRYFSAAGVDELELLQTDQSSKISDMNGPEGKSLINSGSDSEVDLVSGVMSSDVLTPGMAAARTRVMRCGKCSGCNAADCMKCRHCLDMKKYGGPGLRKQSCKNRKCITPKVVMLNQPKDNEGGEGIESSLLELASVAESVAEVDTSLDFDTEQKLANGGPSTFKHQQLQELSKQLLFHCPVCKACFINTRQLLVHTEFAHPNAGDYWNFSKCQYSKTPSRAQDVTTKQWLRVHRFIKADYVFQDPVVQYAILGGIRQQFAREFTPIGYAKLEGPGLVYYMLRPRIVLGRLSSRWRQIYLHNGIEIVPGLTGGSVDCHLGDDETIAHKHALICWNKDMRCFEISCLTWLHPITVNGREISYSSSPAMLRTRNIVQIGSHYFFFLLPKPKTKSYTSRVQVADKSKATPVIPATEIRAWAEAKVERQKAANSLKRSLQEKLQDDMLKRRKSGLFHHPPA